MKYKFSKKEMNSWFSSLFSIKWMFRNNETLVEDIISTFFAISLILINILLLPFLPLLCFLGGFKRIN